jgi:hypothetical protein
LREKRADFAPTSGHRWAVRRSYERSRFATIAFNDALAVPWSPKLARGPECSKKKLPLGALIVHVNDAHHWTRERIAAWVADPDVPQDESHAHH